MPIFRDKSIKWWFGAVACTGLFLAIVVFAYAKTTFLVKGVEIKADIIKNSGSSLVEVAGNAKNSTHLRLNGREIFIDKSGNFSEMVGLLPGLSIISIEAKDKFGKEDSKKFEIVYEGENDAVASRELIIN